MPKIRNIENLFKIDCYRPYRVVQVIKNRRCRICREHKAPKEILIVYKDDSCICRDCMEEKEIHGYYPDVILVDEKA